VGGNSPPAAAFFVCLVVSFGMVTGLRVVQRGRQGATVMAAAARTTSYKFDEAGKVDVGRCFIGNGGEQGAVGCLFACLALLSALVFHHFTLFLHGNHIKIFRYRLGIAFAAEVNELVTCSGVLIHSSSLDISVNTANGAPEAESEKKRAIYA